ncbi:MAG TPA: hypothetical protein VL137_01065 [Polyangiaceae bacterium]|nr:hypothetical protein [Polyangiaceae bacterium]
MKHLVCTLIACLLLCGALVAQAAEGEAFARVTAAEGEVRAGPGVAYRVIYRAQRGEAFVLRARENSGYWLQVVLADGRTGFLLGDTVEVIAAGESSEGLTKPGFFAPPALASANGGMTALGGLFDGHAYAEVRPSFVLDPSLSIDPYVGLSLASSGRSLLYGAGATLNIVPSWAIAPYLHLGSGGYHFSPNQDAFVPSHKDTFHLRAGGGLLVSLRWRLLFRIEATNTILFTADSYANVQTYTAGFGTYF